MSGSGMFRLFLAVENRWEVVFTAIMSMICLGALAPSSRGVLIVSSCKSHFRRESKESDGCKRNKPKP